MKGNYRHGMRYTRLYNIWKSMRQRCSNPNCINYHNYGGKGITVCEEWQNSFKPFHKWAMENGYEETLTIDRIDSNGNYEPSNCRWTTYRKQANNRANNMVVEFDGVSHTLGEWAEITGLRRSTIWARIKRGWDVEKALTTKAVVGRNQSWKV